MRKDFFTADTHFGHTKIIEYTDRPFISRDEHDEAMIANWNNVVAPSSNVYVLADFTLGDEDRARYYFSRLHGRIFVIGCHFHHDRHWLPKTRLGNGKHMPYFGKCSNLVSKSGYEVTILPPIFILEYKHLSTDRFPLAIYLSHYPTAVWDRKHHGSWHLHGHSHGYYSARGKILDVGVDTHQFTPWSLDEIATYMSTR